MEPPLKNPKYAHKAKFMDTGGRPSFWSKEDRAKRKEIEASKRHENPPRKKCKRFLELPKKTMSRRRSNLSRPRHSSVNVDAESENEDVQMEFDFQSEPCSSQNVRVSTPTPKVADWRTYIKRFKPMRALTYSHQEEWAEFLNLYEPGGQLVPRCIVQGCIPFESVMEPMTLYASPEMISDFKRLIAFLEFCGSGFAGLALIVPPEGYVARKDFYEDCNFSFNKPQRQYVNQRKGLNEMLWLNYDVLDGQKMDFQSFYEYCCACNPTPDSDDLDKPFHQYISLNSSIYCKDEEGSLFDEENILNLNKLQNPLRAHGKWKKYQGAGIVSSYLYLSSFGSAFADHIEDYSSYSANYNHFGHDKIWTGTPPSYGFKGIAMMDDMRKKIFPKLKRCNKLALHKLFYNFKSTYEKYNVPTVKLRQPAGTFVITFPFAFHQGYSEGFACGEAVNFAYDKKWILQAMWFPGCQKSQCFGGTNAIFVYHRGLNCFFRSMMSNCGKMENLKDGILMKLFADPLIKSNPAKKIPFPLHPIMEDLEISLKIRKIFRSPEEIPSLLQLDIYELIKEGMRKKK